MKSDLFRAFAAGAAFLCASAALADPVPAQSFSFSYTVENGATFTALISGVLGGDSNTVTVLGFSGAKVDGANWDGTYEFGSIDASINADPGADPRMTLDGSFVDVYFGPLNGAPTDGAIGFGVDSVFGNNAPYFPVITTGTLLGISEGQVFDVANYSLTAVPLPGGLVLLGTGLGFLVLRRRG